MAPHANFLKRFKMHFLFFILLMASLHVVYAQQKQPKKTLQEKMHDLVVKEQQLGILINTTTGLLHWTKDLIYSADAFKNVSKMNKDQFNKNVKVVKADTGKYNPASSIPQKEITHPKISNGEFTNLNWTPVAYFDSSLFPSAIIAMATYKGKISDDNQLLKAIQRPIGFHIISDRPNIPLKYEIECVDKRFFDKVSGYILYQQSKQMYDFNISIPWNFATLAGTVSPTSISVHFRLFDEDGNMVDKTEVLTVRSINDCVSRYKDVNLEFMYAAYVQEENPKLDALLRAGLDTKITSAFDAYQEDADQVDRQVLAIWRVLHEQGFQYSSITRTTIVDTNFNSQTVRTCDNALKTKQANCVDGTVLFASILRKIGIDPIIITCNEYNMAGIQTGGHCFLAYATIPGVAYRISDNDSLMKYVKYFHFVETTTLDQSSVRISKTKTESLATAKTPADKNKVYKDILTSNQDYALCEYLNKVHDTYGEDKQIEIKQVASVSLCRDLIGAIPVTE